MSTDDALDLAAVSALADVVMDRLRDDDGRVHIDTALAGLAAVAGASMLRSIAGSLLDTLEPGGHVVMDRIDEEGPLLLDLVSVVARNSGIPWPDGVAEIPPDHLPAASPAVLVAQLEAPLAQVLEEREVDPSMWPAHLGLACVDLVRRAGDVADLPSAASIVATGIVAGSKTVPPRRTS